MDESGAAVGFKRSEGGGAVLLFFELFDLELGLLEAGLAGLEQRVALFELGEELGQRNVAGFHRFDDGFKAGEGVLEGRCWLGFIAHNPSTLRAPEGFSIKHWSWRGRGNRWSRRHGFYCRGGINCRQVAG